jgi:hypothetical protein
LRRNHVTSLRQPTDGDVFGHYGFGNVERVASERIGRETVTYVSNIYKYYITYRLSAAQPGATRSGEGGGREAQVNVNGAYLSSLTTAARHHPLWAVPSESPHFVRPDDGPSDVLLTTDVHRANPRISTRFPHRATVNRSPVAAAILLSSQAR